MSRSPRLTPFDVDEYLTVDCPFCLVLEEQPCVKLYGKNAGDPTGYSHIKRAYKYHRIRRERERVASDG